MKKLENFYLFINEINAVYIFREKIKIKILKITKTLI